MIPVRGAQSGLLGHVSQMKTLDQPPQDKGGELAIWMEPEKISKPLSVNWGWTIGPLDRM